MCYFVHIFEHLQFCLRGRDYIKSIFHIKRAVHSSETSDHIFGISRSMPRGCVYLVQDSPL